MKKNVVAILVCGMLAISTLAGCGNKAEAPAAPAETATEEKTETPAEEKTEAPAEADTDAAADEACSDETFAQLQDIYAALVEAHDATVEAYNSDEIAADPEIEDALKESEDLIAQVGEISQDDITEADALEVVDAMLAINDIFAACLDQMQPVADDITDISDSLAGSVWIDDDLNIYGFDTDGSTLILSIMDDDGEYIDAEGEYALYATDEGYVGLTMVAADVEVDAVLTDYSDETLEFTDINTGESAIFYPYEEN